MTIWNESGKWDERGLGVGKYCMARRMDSGGYSKDNVYITTCDDNVRDYQARLKVDGVMSPDGWVRLPENEKAVTGGDGPTRYEVMGSRLVCRRGHPANRDKWGNCRDCSAENKRKYREKGKVNDHEYL
jgi:hypothetical protein